MDDNLVTTMPQFLNELEHLSTLHLHSNPIVTVSCHLTLTELSLDIFQCLINDRLDMSFSEEYSCVMNEMTSPSIEEVNVWVRLCG